MCLTCEEAVETSRDNITSISVPALDATLMPGAVASLTRSQGNSLGFQWTAPPEVQNETGDWTGAAIRRNAPAGYDLCQYLGGGGMGDVYLAREHAAERTVAMKFLRASPHSLASDRFLTEVRALARLDHPNIVRVISVDLNRVDPHFTMEYASGGTLADRLKNEGPLPPEEAARIMAVAARAIDSAHRANILHRDLKPSNIVLAADRMPKITDFGLAKRTDQVEGLTKGSSPLGTPAYMPPEQVSPRFGQLGPAADVYGLGATLYHLLTGLPPFQGDHAEVLVKVVKEEPQRPRLLRPDLPMKLEAIVIKCLEKSPGLRYESAAELADDLDRFLSDEMPIAPQLTRFRRLKRWTGRNRFQLGASLLGILVLGAAVGLAVAPYWTKPPITATDPLEAIQRDLQAGRAVKLVDATGPPRWHAWKLTPSSLGESSSNDRSASFQTNLSTFLELIRDPGIERYRVTAELRHMGGDPPSPGGAVSSGFIGFYCGHDEQWSQGNKRINSFV
ncbi:MAG TPA: serine/threonine-protein kinase, partial [Urbifossiella sp.]